MTERIDGDHRQQQKQQEVEVEEEATTVCGLCVTPIEVFRTPGHYVLTRGEHSLWCCFHSGDVCAKHEADVSVSASTTVAASGGVCIGVCEGFIGRLQTHTDGGYYLLLARTSEVAGCLASGHTVRRLTSVVCLPLIAHHQYTPNSCPALGEHQLTPCAKHCGQSSSSDFQHCSAAISATTTAAELSTSSAQPTPSFASPRSTWSVMRDAATRVSSVASSHVRGLRRAEPVARDATPPTFFVSATADCDESGDVEGSPPLSVDDPVSTLTTTGGGGGSISSLSPSPSSSSLLFSSSPPISAVLDDILKLLNDSESFYFSVGHDSDITASVQRLNDHQALDTRFVWNWALLQCLGNAPVGGVNVDDCSQVSDRSQREDNPQEVKDGGISRREAESATLCASPWFLPLIQGFYQSVELFWPDSTDSVDSYHSSTGSGGVSTVDRTGGNSCCGSTGSSRGGDTPPVRQFRLTVVSRRSRFRAGTRYLRRGVDADGHTANYVETEQILSCGKHHLSFVQVRGSVPVFWSQPGNQFRPPPLIHTDPVQTQLAFTRHMNAELQRFSRLHLVSLVDLSGRERALSDAYLDCVLVYNSAAVTFTAFDFHEHCRGLKFENVALLIGSLSEAISTGGFTWADDRGVLRRQSAVFRTNCVDCLDRTNVVQTAIARQVLDKQLTKLGVLPRSDLSDSTSSGAADPIRSVFQEMWADNGDAISRQYAGTGALKADYTRTGERRLAGVIGDGVRSASRYYLKRFRDASRQTAIDVLLGTALVPSTTTQAPPTVDTVNQTVVDGDTSGDVASQSRGVDADDAERVRLLVQEACALLVGDEVWRVLGAWPMIEATTDSTSSAGTEVDTDTDTVLILTAESFVVVAYDDSVEQLTAFQTVPLTDLVSIELLRPPDVSSTVRSSTSSSGCSTPASAASAARQLLRAGVAAAVSPRSSRTAVAPPHTHSTAVHCIRLHYRIGDTTGYFHQFRAAGVRFFNNVPLPVHTVDQQIEALTAIADAISGACSVQKLSVCVRERVWDGRSSRSLGETADTGVTRQNSVLSLLRWKRRRQRRNSLSGGRDLWSVGVANENSAQKHSAAGDCDLTLSDTQLYNNALGGDNSIGDASMIGTNPQRSQSLVDHQPIKHEQRRVSPSRLMLPDIAVTPLSSDASASSGRSVSLANRLGSALSPITSPARDTVMSGFSLLARGVQRHLVPTGLSVGSTQEASGSATHPRPDELSERMRERIAGSLTTVVIL